MSAAYASLPPLGALTVALLYAEVDRMQDRARRVHLFGDEVRFRGVTRRAKNARRERVPA